MSRDQASILGILIAVLLLFSGIAIAVMPWAEMSKLFEVIAIVAIFWVCLFVIGKIGWLVGGSVHDIFRAIKISKQE